MTDTIYREGRFYDALLGDYAGGAELSFYRRLIREAEGPVLELCCGTGRLTIPLAEDGWDVTGLDAAEPMLAEARRKAQGRGVEIPWIHADARRFYLTRKFALAFIPVNSLAHFPERRDLESLLASVRRHLLPDGRFVVAMFNPDLQILDRDPEQEHPVGEFYHPETQKLVHWTETNRYDRARQINHIRWFFRQMGAEEVQELAMRIFFPRELEALLHYNGFAIDTCYGDYDGQPFTSESPHQLWVCRASK